MRYLVFALCVAAALAGAGGAEVPRIINAHEHVADERGAAQLQRVMDRAGIDRTVLLGTSRFSFVLRERVGFTGVDENNAFILELARRHPDRFLAWPTLDPEDPEKLEKLKAMVAAGATGLKLYTGHGYVRRDTGQYMFHPMALDDPRMSPVYEYCVDQGLPVLIHVNPDRPGFADELVSMLTRFPRMKVICPHFLLSTKRLSRLEELLDVFPNLYCDISLGHDDFMAEGFETLSRGRDTFLRILDRFPDRFFFGADLVYKAWGREDDDWYIERIETYYRFLARDTYGTAILPGRTLRGLGLGEARVAALLGGNFERFLQAAPDGGGPRRPVNWRAMRVWRTNRAPGEALPPPRERGWRR